MLPAITFEEFKTGLEELGWWNKYQVNLANEKVISYSEGTPEELFERHGRNIISSSFEWDITPEGYEFWSDLDKALTEGIYLDV